MGFLSGFLGLLIGCGGAFIGICGLLWAFADRASGRRWPRKMSANVSKCQQMSASAPTSSMLRTVMFCCEMLRFVAFCRVCRSRRRGTRPDPRAASQSEVLYMFFLRRAQGATERICRRAELLQSATYATPGS